FLPRVERRSAEEPARSPPPGSPQRARNPHVASPQGQGQTNAPYQKRARARGGARLDCMEKPLACDSAGGARRVRSRHALARAFGKGGGDLSGGGSAPGKAVPPPARRRCGALSTRSSPTGDFPRRLRRCAHLSKGRPRLAGGLASPSVEGRR